MKIAFRKWLLSTVCVLGTCFPLVSQAEPYFTNKAGDQILDKATGLVWQRCSLGQTWNGTTCAGEAKKFNFAQAQQQAGNGWRVPTIRELASLIFCSSYQTRAKKDPKDGGPELANNCTGNYSYPTLNTAAFPATPFFPSTVFPEYSHTWSSSTYVGNANYAWYIHFNDGSIDYYNRQGDNHVRLVLANQSLGSEAALEFTYALPNAPDALIMTRKAAEDKRQAERKAAEDKREAERKAEEIRQAQNRADKAAAVKRLIASGAQSLYLEAGKAQRNGGVAHNGQSFSASELYELILQHFPKSEYAVKASDQLSANSRAESNAQAARNQGNYNRQQCEAQKASCLASCPPWRSTLGKDFGGEVNRAHFECESRCKNISCN